MNDIHIADGMHVVLGNPPQPEKPDLPPESAKELPTTEEAISADTAEVIVPEPAAVPLPRGVAYGVAEALRWTQDLALQIRSVPLRQSLDMLLAECNPASPATLTFEPNRPNRLFRTLAEICGVLDERLLKIEAQFTSIDVWAARFDSHIFTPVEKPAASPDSASAPGPEAAGDVQVNPGATATPVDATDRPAQDSPEGLLTGSGDASSSEERSPSADPAAASNDAETPLFGKKKRNR